MLVRLLTLLFAISLTISSHAIVAYAQVSPPGPGGDSTEVDTISHYPHFLGHRSLRCSMQGDRYIDSIYVRDYNLANGPEPETLTLRVLEPTGFVVTPSVVYSPSYDTFAVMIESPQLNAPPGKLKIALEARDAKGYADTTWYYVAISERPSFSMPVIVRNTNAQSGNNSFQLLTFGIGDKATTGYESASIGHHDTQYCEFELPPSPPIDVFDARWIIPTTSGTLRAIYPLTSRDAEPIAPWQAHFNAGGATGSNHPVVIEWSKLDARRSPVRLFLYDQFGGDLFAIDMQTGAHTNREGMIRVEDRSDSVWIFINVTSIDGFYITREGTFDVPSSSELQGDCTIEASAASSNNGASFAYHIPISGDLSIAIADTRGSIVRTLRVDHAERGSGSIDWDGTDEHGTALPNGIYLCRLSAGTHAASCRIILLR